MLTYFEHELMLTRWLPFCVLHAHCVVHAHVSCHAYCTAQTRPKRTHEA